MALLLVWNRKINLIARRDETWIWRRHVNDSLQLAKLIPPGIDGATDLGSGAGFPGMVLAIATGICFTLVEADARKCAFLREAARATSAPVTVVNERIEATTTPPAALITARALAPLTELLALSHRLLAPGGTLLFPKGISAESEIEIALRQWTMRVERHISETGGGGMILRISEVQRA